MKIQTRRHILEIWRATVDHCYDRGTWRWGGQSGANSISDAEQLLTILYPATVIDSLSFDNVDTTADDVLKHLRSLGNASDIPRQLSRVIGEYMRAYEKDGTPDFSGGSYFDSDDPGMPQVKDEQRLLEVVDAYSMSVTLCLSTLSFLKAYRKSLHSTKMIREADELTKLCSRRLTAAMVGLLRSFTVNTFDPKDPPGEILLRALNPRGVADDPVVRALNDELAEVRASLRQELDTGLFIQDTEELQDERRLFECGWSWGVIDGAPKVDGVSGVERQSDGVAEARPSLYFTVVALDGIGDLFSERTRTLGLLNGEQQRLAQALQLRSELTRRFWATIATFDVGGRWPLADLPWTATDGHESDYYSVFLTSILIQNADNALNKPNAQADLERIGYVLGELAKRGRITNRPVKNDAAVALHIPGILLGLVGSEKVAEGPKLRWTVASYTALMLKLVLTATRLLADSSARSPLIDLANEMWAHVEGRRIEDEAGYGLWDEPTQVFTDTKFDRYEVPSWYQTERVMEALVAAAGVIQNPPTADAELADRARRLLAEAEYLFDQEEFRGAHDTGRQMRESFQVVGTKLRRAWSLLDSRPGTASVLASDVLRELNEIDAGRHDTVGMS
jgi:hypothetical protein